jgi:hypothetical protein
MQVTIVFTWFWRQTLHPGRMLGRVADFLEQVVIRSLLDIVRKQARNFGCGFAGGIRTMAQIRGPSWREAWS